MNVNKNLEKKQELVAFLQEGFQTSVMIVATDYKGLNVENISSFRRQMHDVGAKYQVAKNTLLRRAADGNQAAEILESFIGPTAVAYTDSDPVILAKALVAFAKANEEKFSIKSVVMNGKAIQVSDLKVLSDLPPKEVLLSQLLAVMQAVPTSFVRVLNAVPTGLVNVLSAIKDQKEAA